MMKLISPRWSSLAIEHFSDRRKLPSIKCLRFTSGMGRNFVVWINLSRRFLQYFRVENWNWYSVLGSVHSGHQVVTLTHHFNIGNQPERGPFDRLVNIFERCSRIGRLEFKVPTAIINDEIECIKNMTESIVIDEVVFNIHILYYKYDLNIIMPLIKVCSIRSLVITSDEHFSNISNIIEECHQFFRDSIRYVSSIKIRFIEMGIQPGYWPSQAVDLARAAQVNAKVDEEDGNDGNTIVTITVTALEEEEH